MLQQVYKTGFERRPFSVFGVRLHPLTLGHVQLLAEMDSNIPFPPVTFELDDVGKLMFAASFPRWEDARSAVEKTEILKMAFECIAKADQSAVKIGIQQAGEYIGYYLARPASNAPATSWAECRVPWWWSYAEFMQSGMGRTEAQAWATICTDAFAYWACHVTRHGDDQVSTQREAGIRELIKSGKTMKQLFDEGVI